VQENLRELIEQAAAYSGAADDESMSERIAAQQAQLEMLTKRRAELTSALSPRDN
jgi:cell division protein FtsB